MKDRVIWCGIHFETPVIPAKAEMEFLVQLAISNLPLSP
jgi:hypothetical protein